MKNALLILVLLSSYPAFSQVDTLSGDTAEQKHPKPILGFSQDDNRFTLGFEYGMTYAYRKTKSSAYQELIDCRAEHEQGILTINFGLTARYEINDRLEIVSGISFFETGFDFSEEKQMSDTLDLEFLMGCDVDHVVSPHGGYTGAGFSDPRFGYVIYGLHPDHGTLQIKTRYTIWEVPLLARLNFGKDRTHFFVAAGAGVDYMKSAEQVTSVITDANVISTYTWVYNHNDYKLFNAWNGSALLNTGVEYKMKDNLSVGLNLAGRYQLRNIFHAGRYFARNYQENHFTVSGSAGVYLHF